MPIETDGQTTITQQSVYGNLRSEAMGDIISRKPGFSERWALPLFVLVFLLLLGATWFIHYPDVIKTRATLTATNAPKEIVVLQEGRLVKLFRKNDSRVLQGDVLAFIESNAKHEQVLVLRKDLDTILTDLQKNNTQQIVTRFAENRFDALGELQQGYRQFVVAYQQFSDYLQDGFYLKKKQILAEDFSYLQKNHEIVEQQKELLQKDLMLSEETYKANASLLKDKVISKQDERNEQSKLLGKRLSIPQVNASLLVNQALQREKQKEINELEHGISQQKILFQQAAQIFQNEVGDWIRKFVLVTPAGGKIIFPAPLQENQFLKTGKSIAFVIPEDTRYYAEVNLPQYNFGKVHIGQHVQLRFDAYPYPEFGYVKGVLAYITDFATDSGFLAHIELKDGLFTDRHKTLHYRDGLRAEAQIITKEMRLIQRFYYMFTSSMKR